MTIEAITNIKTYNSIISAVKRSRIVPIYLDMFSPHIYGEQKFEKITLETAKKLYNTHFTPQQRIFGENIYSTFVLDKMTEKPVGVVVKLSANTKHFEEYCIYDESGKNMLGKKHFMLSEQDKIIYPGYMQTLSEDYLGIGLRLHQIAIERMFMKKMDNVEIICLPKAYNFHKGCGFEPIHSYNVVDESTYRQILRGFMHDYGISEKDLAKMMVSCNSLLGKGKIVWDKYFSYENILKYLYSREDKSLLESNHLSIHMRLADKSFKEWKNLIESSPIRYGKNAVRSAS